MPRTNPRRRPSIELRLLTIAACLLAVGPACSPKAPPETPRAAATAPAAPEPSGSSPTKPATSAGCHTGSSTPMAGGDQVETAIPSGGATRTYQLHVPARYVGQPMPLVIDLHGYLSGAAGQIAMSNLAATADTEGFIVATPQGNGPLPYWNAVPHPDLPDDVQFVADVIDDVGRALCVDGARIYVEGFSNGAFLTSLVACRLADRVAAVAAVAGLMVPEGCTPTRPIPILAIHGTADQYVTFDGTKNVALDGLSWDAASTRAFTGLAFAPVRDSIARWAGIDGCGQPATEQPVAASTTLVTYRNCRGGTDVELYVLAGAGHTWPSSAFADASAPILGPATHDIDASKVIWAFFQAHALPT